MKKCINRLLAVGYFSLLVGMVLTQETWQPHLSPTISVWDKLQCILVFFALVLTGYFAGKETANET